MLTELLSRYSRSLPYPLDPLRTARPCPSCMSLAEALCPWSLSHPSSSNGSVPPSRGAGVGRGEGVQVLESLSRSGFKSFCVQVVPRGCLRCRAGTCVTGHSRHPPSRPLQKVRGNRRRCLAQSPYQCLSATQHSCRVTARSKAGPPILSP